MAHSLLSGFIYLAISVIVLANVYMYIIHNTSQNVNLSAGPVWSPAEIALWSVLGLAGIIALLMGALQLSGVM
jgi:hypothetical protein